MSTPIDKCGYMFTESYGPGKHYRLVLGFETLEDLHAAQDFVVSLRQKGSTQETPAEHCKHGIGWYECSICMHPEAVPGARASRCNHPEGARSLTNRCQICDTQVVEQG